DEHSGRRGALPREPGTTQDVADPAAVALELQRRLVDGVEVGSGQALDVGQHEGLALGVVDRGDLHVADAGRVELALVAAGGIGPPPRFARPSSVICSPAGIGRKRLLITVGFENGTDLNFSAGAHDGASAAVEAVLARPALTPPAPTTITARTTALAKPDRR